jgi:hypothetical protein
LAASGAGLPHLFLVYSVVLQFLIPDRTSTDAASSISLLENKCCKTMTKTNTRKRLVATHTVDRLNPATGKLDPACQQSGIYLFNTDRRNHITHQHYSPNSYMPPYCTILPISERTDTHQTSNKLSPRGESEACRSILRAT